MTADEKAIHMLIRWGLKQKYDYWEFMKQGGDFRDHVYTYAVHLAKAKLREHYYPQPTQEVKPKRKTKKAKA